MGGRQESFGERLRRHREAAGFSQEHLAERAGMSANAVGALERGERRRPYPDTVRRLADALGLADEARAELVAALRDDADAAGPSSAPIIDLPGEPTPLIGREHEVDEVGRLLADADTRLLTLVGPGGVGKTRLALHLAHLALDAYDDGVVWVELASLADPDLVPATIGRTIGLEESSPADLESALHSWFHDRRALLVLDNVEHLVDAIPGLVRLLLACPRLRMLTTSRSPLKVRGEREYPVPPLEVPPDDGTGDGREPTEFSSVRFFVWQAQQRDPTFELTAPQAEAVVQLCRRLDGLPLALELVAARVRVLDPEELLARVDHLMPLLVGGARDLPERQRTMRAAIAWSENLLSPTEQTLFRRLAVFAGGATLKAAEAVGAESMAESETVLDRLEALVGQSLVTVTRDHEGTRYGMLEPVRQYALERLTALGEDEGVRRRHARHFQSLAERAAVEIEGRSGQSVWVDRLERELDNLRAALAWSERADRGAEIGLRLGAALWRFWEMRWRVDEGGRWLAGALSRSEGQPLDVRASALNAAGNLARDRGDYPRASAYHEECLQLRRRLGNARGIASSLNNLGVIARDRGDAERTLDLCQESLELFRRAGDRHGAAIALISLGAASEQRGDLDGARSCFQESLELFRAENDNWHTAWVLTYLAELMVRRHDPAAARRLAEEGLAMHRTGGDPWGIATALGVLGKADQAEGASVVAARRFADALRVAAEARVERAIPACLEDLAGVLLASGHPDRAARLAGAGEVWRTPGLTRAPVRSEDLTASLHALHDGPHSASWIEGRGLSREQVLREAADVPRLVAAAVT